MVGTTVGSAVGNIVGSLVGMVDGRNVVGATVGDWASYIFKIALLDIT